MTEKELGMALVYLLAIAPVVIHIKLSKVLAKLVHDTAYRNQVK